MMTLHKTKLSERKKKVLLQISKAFNNTSAVQTENDKYSKRKVLLTFNFKYFRTVYKTKGKYLISILRLYIFRAN